MSWLDGMCERLRDSLRPDERERELNEEIQNHLELEMRSQLGRGHEETAARAIALSRFGNPEWIKQATRDQRGSQPLESAMQDLGWAIRTLRKHGGFTSLALITLALGIGATTVAFTVMDTVLLRPLPYREPDRLVLIQEMNGKQQPAPPSYPNFVDWRDQARSFEGVVSLMFPWSVTVVAQSEPLRAPLAGVSRAFFAALGVAPVIGREFTADENVPGGPPVVMVTHEFWQSQMGGRTPLGTIRVGSESKEVVGVLPSGYRLAVDAQLFFPHEQWPGTQRSAHNYIVIARLSPNATLASARREMTALSRALRETHGTDTGALDARVSPLREYLVGDYHTMLVIVLGAAILVLLIACTNLVSAQLARGFSREREVAVRAALGASRARLIRQLFVESAVLTTGGAVLGIAFAFGLTHVVRLVGSGLVPRLDELAVDGRVLLFTVGVAAVTAALVGLYPALRLAGDDPGDTLRGATRATNAVRRSKVWPLLIGFEIAMAVVLLVGSALLVRTMHNILSSDVGFDPRGVLTAALSPEGLDAPTLERIRTQLAALPGVQDAALVSRLPLSWGSTAGPVLRPEDPPHAWPALAGFRVATPQYFSVLRQPVLHGRAFTHADRAESPMVAIITDGIAVKLWPGQDAVGKQIRTNYLSTQWLTVVGVVREASSWTMARGSQNEIYTPLAQQPEQGEAQLIVVMRTGGDPRALVNTVGARLRALAPSTPARIETMEDRIERSAADRRFAMIAFVAFAGVALVLAGIGIYGVTSYSVVSRRHEIGVRMALGATSLDVQADVMRVAALMAMGGIATGGVAAVAASRYVESVLYGVSRLDPVAYVVGCGVLLLTALLGAYVPALRSSRIDPLIVMRGD